MQTTSVMMVSSFELEVDADLLSGWSDVGASPAALAARPDHYRAGMTPDVQVSRTIAAPPDVVFAALTDITRMGEWSPETIRAEWNGDVTEPAVGATFTGHNRNGENEWTTEAEIVELEPNERFFFDCSVRGYVFSRWGYTIEPADGGSLVTEYAQDLRPESALERSAQISGVTDRLAHNRAGMEATLERLAAALE